MVVPIVFITMAKNSHLRKVTDKQILSVLERGDLKDRFGRKALKPKEVAEALNDWFLESEKITGEGVRQRMLDMEGIETQNIGNATLYNRKGVIVWADSKQNADTQVVPQSNRNLVKGL